MTHQQQVIYHSISKGSYFSEKTDFRFFCFPGGIDHLHDRHYHHNSLFFSGCLRNLLINGLHLPLTSESGWEGVEIDDCDGTECGGEVCSNGGVCSVQEKVKYFASIVLLL